MNLKKTQIINGFLNYIADTEIKHFINETEQHNIDNTLNNKQSINLYYKNKFYYNYKVDVYIFKTLIQKNIHPTAIIKNMTNNPSIAIHAFGNREFTSFSVNETLLPWWGNLYTSFREPPFSIEISPLWFRLKHIQGIAKENTPFTL